MVLAGASCALAQLNPDNAANQQPRASVQKPPTRPPAAPGPKAAPAKTAESTPVTTVVTISGVCKERQANKPCKTVITQEDLEKFISSNTPDASESAKVRSAIQYAKSTALASLAEQQGLDKSPTLAKEIETQMKLARMRVLANAYMQRTRIQAQTMPVAEAEIRKYYAEHTSIYERGQIRRIALPLLAPSEDGRRLDPAVLKAEMQEIRKRAVAGESLETLQLEAFQHVHIQAPAPPVRSVQVRRTDLQSGEAKAFDLKPGEVTEVLDLPGAFAIIQLESKDVTPYEAARPEIEAGMRRDRVQTELSKLGVKVSAEFNLEYLGLASQPDIFAPTAFTPAPTRAAARKRFGNAPSRQ
jgi:hypothetical protein